MKELNSEVALREKDGQDKQYYEKPSFTLIALIADKVLALCKLTPFPAPGYCEEVSAQS